MSLDLNTLLLAVFLVHLAVFARLAVRRRELYYAVASLTFVLLVAVFAVRLFAPEAQWWGQSVARLLRVAAWGSGAVSLSLFVRRRWGRPSADGEA